MPTVSGRPPTKDGTRGTRVPWYGPYYRANKTACAGLSDSIVQLSLERVAHPDGADEDDAHDHRAAAASAIASGVGSTTRCTPGLPGRCLQQCHHDQLACISSQLAFTNPFLSQ